jgi:hypothetical protein
VGVLSRERTGSTRRRRRGKICSSLLFVDGFSSPCKADVFFFGLKRSVTLQSCIVDNKASLSAVIREIDKVIKGDVVSVLVCFSSSFSIGGLKLG